LAFILNYSNGMPYSDLFIHAKLKNTIEHCRRHCYRTTVKHSIKLSINKIQVHQIVQELPSANSIIYILE